MPRLARLDARPVRLKEAEFQAANSTLAGFRFNLSNQNELVFLCERARLKYLREKHEQLNPSVWLQYQILYNVKGGAQKWKLHFS